MKIAIDLDDVLCDMSSVLPIKHLELEEQIRILDIFFKSDTHLNVPPVKDSQLALSLLHKEGNDLYIATSRNNNYRKPTLEWLEKYFPGYFGRKHVYMNTRSYRNDKILHLMEINPDIFIDDNLELIKEARVMNITSYRFDNWTSTLDHIKRSFR